MTVNRLLLATLAGGIAYFLLGFLVYAVLLENVFALPPETEQVIQKQPMAMWAMVMSCLVWAFLLAMIYARWAGISTFKTGAMAGAVIGLLVSLSVNLSMFSMYNFVTIPALVADCLANGVITGITGGVVGWVLGRGDRV